jgi:hypothetical protein
MGQHRGEVQVVGEHNLRDPNYQPYYWDRLNEIVQRVTGRKNWRFCDIDGAGHFREGNRIILLEGTENPAKPYGGQNEMMQGFLRNPQITVVSFTGPPPDPPKSLDPLIEVLARGDLPPGFYQPKEEK